MDTHIDTAQLLSQVTTTAPKADKTKGQNAQKMRETAQQFEAIFIQQMYKEMRKTVPEGGLLPKSGAEESFEQMMDQEAALATARQGGIGLAEMMMQQLMKNQ